MSARREKRLRQLERRVDALEFTADRLAKMQDHTDFRLAEMTRIQTEIKVPIADWKPAPARPSWWARLKEKVTGRRSQ